MVHVLRDWPLWIKLVFCLMNSLVSLRNCECPFLRCGGRRISMLVWINLMAKFYSLFKLIEQINVVLHNFHFLLHFYLSKSPAILFTQEVFTLFFHQIEPLFFFMPDATLTLNESLELDSYFSLGCHCFSLGVCQSVRSVIHFRSIQFSASIYMYDIRNDCMIHF